MTHVCLVRRPFYRDDIGSMVMGVATGVGSNGSALGRWIRFHNIGKVGKRLVGCATISKCAHGGWILGCGGMVGSFFFFVPLLLVPMFAVLVSFPSIVWPIRIGKTYGCGGMDGTGTIDCGVRYQNRMANTIFGKVRVVVTWYVETLGGG
jgi:hypothetical protein